jgi:hypothetical protein
LSSHSTSELVRASVEALGYFSNRSSFIRLMRRGSGFSLGSCGSLDSVRVRWIDDRAYVEEVDVDQLPKDGSVRELREAILLNLEAKGDLVDISPADAFYEISPQRCIRGEDLEAQADLVLLQLERAGSGTAEDQVGAVVEESADVRVVLERAGECSPADDLAEASEVF